MPKKSDAEKERKFVELFCEGETAGNATQSCVKAGWDIKNPGQMGAYLRKKLSADIRKKNEERISNMAGKTISRLEQLLFSEQDSVSLNSAKAILEMGNFNPQTLNINVEENKHKTDEELILELQGLVKKIPALAPKFQQIKEATDKDINDTYESDPNLDDKRVIN